MAVRGDENVRERDSVSRRDLSVSCEARAGEKLDSEERRKRKAKEVQEFDGFDVDGRVATLYFTRVRALFNMFIWRMQISRI